MQRTLNFYGTAGNRVSTLEIDRTGPIDLTPFFKRAFDSYFENIAWKLERIQTNAAYSDSGLREEIAGKYKKSYDIDTTKATFTFKVDELFSMFLRKYKPSDLKMFLKDNIIDPEEFGNATLLKRLDNFPADYTRIFFEYDTGPWFRVIPVDKDITPVDIEKAIHPSKIWYDNKERQKNHDEFDAKCDAELINQETSERTKTRRYNCTLENTVESVLKKKFKQKKIIRVYDNDWLCELDYFHIITAFKLPIDNLEIIARNNIILK